MPKTTSGVAYLTVWPQGQSKPLVSTLNDLTNTIVANAAVVPAGTGGEGGVATYASNDTDLVIDINGYFAAPAAGGLSFYALTPCRVIDTRHVGNGQPFTGELTVCGRDQSLRSAGHLRRIRVQRDRGADRALRLSDVVAGYGEQAGGVDAERPRRRHHLEHGNRA